MGKLTGWHWLGFVDLAPASNGEEEGGFSLRFGLAPTSNGAEKPRTNPPAQTHRSSNRRKTYRAKRRNISS
jgi:hypothetical protein